MLIAIIRTCDLRLAARIPILLLRSATKLPQALNQGASKSAMAKVQLIVDLFVLCWFIACWAGYTYFADRKSRHTASLVVAMRLYRREWFKRVLQRENRIADVAAFNSLLTGATFFASTAILILGGLVAMLGATDRVIDVFAELPFARPESELFARVKIILMIGVFVYTFFKFTWAIRQYHFCTILVGAAPFTKEPQEHDDYTDTMTQVASRAAEDFNQGLRAFYFAFAAIAWFFHPWLSVVSSALVVYILHQREFHSRTLQALTGPSTVSRSLHLPENTFRELRLNSRVA
jgi:uncharacterized membrane protein